MPPDDLAPATGWRAHLALGFARAGERTVLARRAHEGPLVVQKALHPEGEGVCHAIVVHPPGGIAGGDRLAIEVRADEGAHALLTTPGAAKWYRSAGPTARQRVRIEARAGSRIEWLPQETIVFDGARADIAWEADVAAGAALVAWDIFCLGRTGSGERFTRGRCRIASRLVRDGRLAWIENATLEADGAACRSPVALAGAPVFGTMVLASSDVNDALLAQWRERSPEEGEGAVTRLPGMLLARYRGHRTGAARAYFASLWHAARVPCFGRPAIEPRIWRT